jgi:3-dehydroquinate dehydratase-1
MARALAIGGVALGPRPRIVAAGGQADVEALAGATGADLVELRADMFDDPQPETVTAALLRLRSAGRPVILTVRAASEGGRPVDEGRRRALYEAGLAHAQAIDLEIASRDLIDALVPRARAAGALVLLSAHSLEATPPADALLALVDHARALGADVAKLATHARNLDDLRTLIRVTLAAGDHGIVTLAMGPIVGPLSRLVLPAAGSLLTYGHVGHETAPGQLTSSELASLLDRLYPQSP